MSKAEPWSTQELAIFALQAGGDSPRWLATIDARDKTIAELRGALIAVRPWCQALGPKAMILIDAALAGKDGNRGSPPQTSQNIPPRSSGLGRDHAAWMSEQDPAPAPAKDPCKTLDDGRAHRGAQYGASAPTAEYTTLCMDHLQAQERARIVAWLRKPERGSIAYELATRIERGEQE